MSCQSLFVHFSKKKIICDILCCIIGGVVCGVHRAFDIAMSACGNVALHTLFVSALTYAQVWDARDLGEVNAASLCWLIFIVQSQLHTSYILRLLLGMFLWSAHALMQVILALNMHSLRSCPVHCKSPATAAAGWNQFHNYCVNDAVAPIILVKLLINIALYVILNSQWLPSVAILFLFC